MKFNFLKNKTGGEISTKRLRPILFDVHLYWCGVLGLVALVLVFTALIGAKMFYDEYFERYKTDQTGNMDKVVNTTKLSDLIQKRNQSVTASTTLPTDPSL